MDGKEFKKIDAHAHIGNFGGWAGVAITAEELIAQMDEYHIEKTLLCAEPNEDCLAAVEKYPDRLVGMVYVNPLEGQAAADKVYYYVQKKGFKGIKANPLKHAYVADTELMDPIMEAAKELDIPVFIHLSNQLFCCNGNTSPAAKITHMSMGIDFSKFFHIHNLHLL